MPARRRGQARRSSLPARPEAEGSLRARPVVHSIDLPGISDWLKVAWDSARCAPATEGGSTAEREDKMHKPVFFAVLAALAAGLAQVAVAQTAYPNRPITVIVPFAAGGPTDVVARIIGDHMSQTLGQQLVIENVGGAGGTTGMTRVAQAAARRLHHRRRQHGHAVGGARALSQPQVQSGDELRADRALQLHAAGDRGQEGHAPPRTSRSSSRTSRPTPTS